MSVAVIALAVDSEYISNLNTGLETPLVYVEESNVDKAYEQEESHKTLLKRKWLSSSVEVIKYWWEECCNQYTFKFNQKSHEQMIHEVVKYGGDQCGHQSKCNWN